MQPVDQVSDRVHFDQLVAGRLHHQEPEGAQDGVRFRREPPVVPLLTLRSCQKHPCDDLIKTTQSVSTEEVRSSYGDI